jgi:hypothetical protein
MRRWGWGCVVAIMLATQVGWGVSQALADPPDQADQPAQPPGSSSLLSQWLKQKTSKSPDTTALTPDTDKPATPKADSGKTQDAKSKDVISERERARADYYRWLKVCDQLQTVAESTGDQALAAEANELSDRAGKVYEARLARLPVPTHASTTAATVKK